MKSILISFFLLFIGTVCVNAQVQFTDDSPKQSASTVDIDDSFFMDEEEKICYIDLERIPVNLKQAALINKQGDAVVVKSLTDEKVDTIVELDYSELPGGSYVLELRSYTGVTAKGYPALKATQIALNIRHKQPTFAAEE